MKLNSCVDYSHSYEIIIKLSIIYSCAKSHIIPNIKHIFRKHAQKIVVTIEKQYIAIEVARLIFVLVGLPPLTLNLQFIKIVVVVVRYIFSRKSF